MTTDYRSQEQLIDTLYQKACLTKNDNDKLGVGPTRSSAFGYEDVKIGDIVDDLRKSKSDFEAK